MTDAAAPAAAHAAGRAGRWPCWRCSSLACLLGRRAAPYRPETMDFAGRFRGTRRAALVRRRPVRPRRAEPPAGRARARPFRSPSPRPSRAPLPAPASARSRPISAAAGTRRSCAPSTPSWRCRSLLLALILVSTLGKGSLNAALAIAIAVAPGMARVTRSVALAVRQQDYVKAAIARGEGGGWIVLREMLPNVAAPVIIETTIRVAFAVMLFATLVLPRPGRPAAGLGMGPDGVGGAPLHASGAVDDRGAGARHRRSPRSASTCWATACATR